MLGDDWELRMERAALQGALHRTRTLEPFVQEMLADSIKDLDVPDLQELIDDANRQLDATEAEMAAKDVRGDGRRE